MGTLTISTTIPSAPIYNPLVPIGASIELKVSEGRGPYTWKVDQPDSILVSVNAADGSIATFTLDETSTITVGVPATITVEDSDGNEGTTMLIPAPAGTLSQRSLLICDKLGSPSPSVVLMVKETGAYTPLHAVPGIIKPNEAASLYQVKPPEEQGVTFVSCYVLNLDRLTDWVPA